MEHAVEHHQHHPKKGDGEPRRLLCRDAHLVPSQPQKHRGEDGGRGHENGDVGGLGQLQGGIFRQKIKGIGKEGDEEKHPLLF